MQAGRNSGEYASLSLSKSINQERSVFVNESYCAIYNPSYSSIPTRKQADVELFHPGVYLNNSFLHPLGCVDFPAKLVANHSVIVERGNCTFYKNALAAQQLNASLLLVVYNESMVTVVPGLDPVDNGPTISIPILFVSNKTGEELKVRAGSEGAGGEGGGVG